VIFQILVLYCQTVKWDWTELAQDRATVNFVGKMHWFGLFQNLLLFSKTVKWNWTEMAHCQGNCILCGQDALFWDIPDPGIVLSDGKMDWTELAKDLATVKCLGKMHWFGMFQKLLLYSQTV